jgi:hypothetical protein
METASQSIGSAGALRKSFLSQCTRSISASCDRAIGSQKLFTGSPMNDVGTTITADG